MDQRTSAASVSPLSRRGGRVILLLFAAAIVGGIGFISYRCLARTWAHRQAEAELQAALADIDAAEPKGWHWSDVEAQRDKVADDANSSVVVTQAAKRLPEDWKGEAIFDEIKALPPPAQLTAQQAESLRSVLERLEPALKEGRKLADYPKGRFPPLTLSVDYFNTPTPHRDLVRDVGAMVFADAVLQCQDKALGKAWTAALATLNTGRSLGDEPLIASQGVRISMQGLAVEALERILAHGTLDTAALQRAAQALRDEMGCELTRIAVRGERAGQQHFYTNLAAGKLDLRDMARWQEQIWWDRADDTTKKTILAGSHAYELRLFTAALDDLKKPAQERAEAFTNWRLRHQGLLADDRVPKLAEVLTPYIWRLAELELRHDAIMECAITAMAAEEYRMRHARWPMNLDELVAAKLLPTTPLDVYDGQPLRLRQVPDGLVVHSVGPLKVRPYEGEAWDDFRTPVRDTERIESLRRERIEFRLWNVEQRRQAPLPPRADDAEHRTAVAPVVSGS